MKKRLFILLIIILVWVVVALSLIKCAPQEEARTTGVATRTPKPTFTATAIPSPTLTPSPTLPPTNTPTSTPVPTNTPIPTNTPAPTNTSVPTSAPTEPPVPTATPTVTPKPTSRPRPTNTRVPKPTNTPPPPFTGTIIRGNPHCGGYAGVTGFVLHASGDPYAGVAVGVWSDFWQGRVGISEADGKFEVTLSDLPPGHYWVSVVQLETCGQAGGQWTAVDCHRLSKPIEVTVTEFCEVNRVTEIEFRGP